MLGLVGKGWAWLCARFSAGRGSIASKDRDSGDRAEISDRIRERYDTARKQVVRPTRESLREHGVLDEWNDTWRASDR